MKRDRITEIKHILMQNKQVDNNELAAMFGVSLATIRRDLDQLEAGGSIRRVYGGAEIIDTINSKEMPEIVPLWEYRQGVSSEEKRAIAKKTVEHIPNSCTVFIDSGTSAFEVAKLLLGRKDLTILTNSLRAAVLLGTHPDMHAYCIGGLIKYDMLSTAGFLASQDLSFFPSIDVSVISADAFEPSWGLRERSMETAILKKIVVEQSKNVIATLDNTKFGAKASAPICRTKEITTIVTDSASPASEIEYLRKIGVEVVIADPYSET